MDCRRISSRKNRNGFYDMSNIWKFLFRDHNLIDKVVLSWVYNVIRIDVATIKWGIFCRNQSQQITFCLFFFRFWMFKKTKIYLLLLQSLVLTESPNCQLFAICWRYLLFFLHVGHNEFLISSKVLNESFWGMSNIVGNIHFYKRYNQNKFYFNIFAPDNFDTLLYQRCYMP